MIIEKRENVKGTIKTVVTFQNEKYVRLQKNKYTGLDMKPVVEWKKLKTNHLVKADKYKLLEEKFMVVDVTTKPIPLYNETSRGSAQMVSSGTTMFFDFQKENYKKTLANNVVEERRKIESSFVKPKLNENTMREMNSFFPNNARRKQFIQEAQKINKEVGALAAVRFIKEKMGYGLYDSKMFFDNAVNK